MNLAADVASASVTPVQINSDEQQHLINSERDQKDPELRKKFEDKLCENLSHVLCNCVNYQTIY